MKLILTVMALSVASCAAPNIPDGFQVLGDRVPEEAGALPIPEGFTEHRPEINEVAPAWTEDEIDRGYVTFTANWMEKIYPRTVPGRTQIGADLAAFCSRGEYEPVTFSVHALRDLQAIQVTVGDLRSDAGRVIRRSDLDVRSVRCWRRRVWKNPPVSQYEIRPWFLEKRDALDVPAGRSQRFWITVRVPENAKAGTYRGQISVHEAAGGVTKLSLAIEVLPITLKAPPTRHGMYYHMFDESTPRPHAPYSADYLAKEVVNMREHGMNTVAVMLYPATPGRVEDGQVKYDLDPVAPFVRSCLASGLGPGIWNLTVDEFLPAYKGPKSLGANIRGFVDSFRARGWPAPVVSFGDESDATDHFQTVRSLGLIKGAVPEATTITTIVFPKNSEMFEPHLDIRAFSSYLDQGGADRTRRAGRQLWMYSGPSEGPRKANRFYRGLWAAALGLDGVLDWVYFTVKAHDRLYDDLAGPGRPNHRGWVLPSKGGPIPTLSWEATREGIDDGKYFHTLERLIEEARGVDEASVTAAARRGKGLLERLYSSVDAAPFGDRYPMHRTCDEMSYESFDAFRYEVAQHIIDLQKKLGTRTR